MASTEGGDSYMIEGPQGSQWARAEHAGEGRESPQ